MNPTTCPIPDEVKALIESALDSFIADAPSEFAVDIASLLDMDEDVMVERFGQALADRLCGLEVSGECEWVETCCITFDCPGWAVLSGAVSVWDSNLGRDIASSEITEDGFDFGTWV